MALVCQAPECDHEFDDAVSWSELDAAAAGETPYFTAVYRPDDGIGVATDYVCSASCMQAYLEEFDGGDGGD